MEVIVVENEASDPPKSWCCAAMLANRTYAVGDPPASPRTRRRPRKASPGARIFSAKPPAALFASDCTGRVATKARRDWARTREIGRSRGFFLRGTTPTAAKVAALANYLSKNPERPGAEGSANAARPASLRLRRRRHRASWWMVRDAGGERGQAAPTRRENLRPVRRPRVKMRPATPRRREASRASVKPDEDPVAAPAATSAAHHPAAERPKHAEAGRVWGQAGGRCRETRGVSAEPAASTAMSPPSRTDRARSARSSAGGDRCGTHAAAAPEAAPAPPPPPAPKDYDIFD